MTQQNDWEDVEIAVKDAPDVTFRGRLIAKISSKDDTRQGDRNKTRWTDLEVYELESGDWVACAVAVSDKGGEIDFARADGVTWIGRAAGFEFINDPSNSLASVQKDRSDEDMQREAMAAFGWSWLAKDMAEKAGWDVIRRFT